MKKKLTYKSTRGGGGEVTASEAILKGLADDGGLFVPERIPQLDVSLGDMAAMTYQETAYEVMKLFFTDFTEEELKECVIKAYDSKFDVDEVAPLVEVADETVGSVHYLELFHGPTIAFKDMALSILPHLMTVAAKKNHVENEIVILTATSGDTGKAALSGFADVEGIRILVFYPKDGVSPIQEKQMLTQKGDNTCVVGVEGNFDDCQNGVKAIFHDQELGKRLEEAGYQFSSANSINIGRLVPQVAYYVYAYARLLEKGKVKEGETIHVVVPTGNFGNILAAYYAKRMGLPIDVLVCASNVNKVLYDFFRKGSYDRNREFFVTSSPSMDILVSSNLERLIYMASREDEEGTAKRMKALSQQGSYDVTDEMRRLMEDFYGGFATEKEVEATIKRVFEKRQYVLDPHTAVASKVYEQFVEETGSHKAAIIISTASPYKFTRSVMNALKNETATRGKSDFELVDELCRLSGVPIPQAVEEIRKAPNRHDMVCRKDEMQAVVEKWVMG